MAAITDLSTASSIAAGDYLVVSQSGTDKKVDVSKLTLYATGTWTPSLLFGGANVGMSYANRGGHYQLLSNYVFIMGIVALTAKGSSTGAATIAGLPYQVKDYVAPIGLAFNDMALDIASTVGLPRVMSVQYFDLMVMAAAGGKSLSQLNHAWFNNTSTLWFSGFYKVA